MGGWCTRNALNRWNSMWNNRRKREHNTSREWKGLWFEGFIHLCVEEE